MRRFLITLISLSLLLGWGLPVRAQAQAAAILYPADVSGFPTVSAFMDVFDASGAFVSGLKPKDVNVVEDGKPLPITDLTELTIPIQIVVAVNPGTALGSATQPVYPAFNGSRRRSAHGHRRGRQISRMTSIWLRWRGRSSPSECERLAGEPEFVPARFPCDHAEPAIAIHRTGRRGFPKGTRSGVQPRRAVHHATHG